MILMLTPFKKNKLVNIGQNRLFEKHGSRKSGLILELAKTETSGIFRFLHWKHHISGKTALNGRKSVESRNQFPKVDPLACGLGMSVGARWARKTLLGKQALANFSATLGISLTFLDVFQKSFGRNAEHRGEGKTILRDKGRNTFRPLGPFIHSSIHPLIKHTLLTNHVLSIVLSAAANSAASRGSRTQTGAKKEKYPERNLFKV